LDGDEQVGRPGQAYPTSLSVKLAQGGTPLAGKTVTWVITNGTGTLSPTSSTTDDQGIATTVVTPGPGSSLTIQASADGVSGGPVSFTELVAGATAQIEVRDNFFDPNEVAITAGGSVTFEWAGSSEHNVAPDDGKDRPSELTTHTSPYVLPPIQFPVAGTYHFHCQIHGASMSGTIVVIP
jgi:plastocyanin